MDLRKMILALSIVLLVSLIGCASKVYIRPINQVDFFRVANGTKIGNVTVQSKGVFMTDQVVKDVLDARLK